MLSRAPLIADLDAVLESDKRVHEPARLVILALLSAVQNADFGFLMTETGLTQGNLSAHLNKLEAAGFVAVEKTFAGKRPRTVLTITQDGRRAFTEHAKTLQRFFKLAGVR
jgi:DNA-binding MarR family transcriptional regulator